jgi:hypothetical protein
MTNDKLIGKLARWAFILQEYEFKVIHRPDITHQNANTMSRKPFPIYDDFSKARQNFDQILTIHVSYAFNYLALLQRNLVEHPIVDIWEDLGTLKFLQHGETSPSYIKSSGSHTTVVQTLLMEGQSPHPMLTTKRQSGSSTT